MCKAWRSLHLPGYTVCTLLLYNYSPRLYTIGTGEGRGGGVSRLYIVIKVTRQKSVSRTIVRSDVVLVDVSQASPPPVPTLPIWYKSKGGEEVRRSYSHVTGLQKSVMSVLVLLLVMCLCRMWCPNSAQVIVQSVSNEPRLCLGRARGCAKGPA